MSKKKEQSALLPLDQPRSVAVRAHGRICTWHFRRLTQQDWMKFFDGIMNRTIRHNGVEERIFTAQTAVVELVDAGLRSVVGYEGVDSEDWKQRLPLQHKLTVGMVLRSVAIDPAPEGPLAALLEVRMSCTWSCSAKDGKMVLYSGLVHRFRHPDVEHLRRFSMEAVRTRILGTGDDGVTVHSVRQNIAIRMYDELIESVEGYTVNGEPLAAKEDIAREMDASHKAAAMLAVFEPLDAVEVV